MTEKKKEFEDKILEIIKEESLRSNVRQYTCTNDFGYSQFERNLANRFRQQLIDACKEQREKKELTIRKFMLKKFPPKKYFDCPIPKEYWGLFDEYAQQQLIDARVDENKWWKEYIANKERTNPLTGKSKYYVGEHEIDNRIKELRLK